MWGLRKKLEARNAVQVQKAQEAQTLADEVIAKVDSQKDEVEELVTRLQQRERANNFGEALVLAMGRRA